MICVLTDLYKKQKELDLEIANNHHVTYEETKDKRLLALLVELGELANATRVFKFWSFKPSESKERVLDEFADGLHFLLSLGLAYDYVLDSIDVEDNELDTVGAFNDAYNKIAVFSAKRSLNSYILAFESYLRILFKLGFSWEEADNAYYLKLQENHHRQETNY